MKPLAGWQRAINLVLFQIGWITCALSGAYGWPLFGPLVVGASVAVQLWWIAAPLRQLSLLMVVAALGTSVDTLLQAAGVTRFHQSLVGGMLCPLWMTALWVNFGATLHQSLAWLQGHLFWACVLGAVGGPLSYWAGSRWGALELGDHALATLAIVWAVITPMLFRLARSTWFRTKTNQPISDLS
jgi:hypothetical protein